MNVLSFSLFGSRQFTKENKWQFFHYLRGLVWNVRMAKLLYPDFLCHLEVDSGTFSDYDNIFYGLKDYYGMSFTINETQPLCRQMLWRLKPVFWENSDYVFARDADALLTNRERNIVQTFIDSGLTVHAITDDPAHGHGLMGGLIGLKCKPIRERYNTWDNMLNRSTIHIEAHGTDQIMLNEVIGNDFKNQTFAHYLNGQKGSGEAIVVNRISDLPPMYSGSNLCVRHMGSPGVVEMETRRFFLRHDKEIPEFEEICKRYPAVFPWYVNE